MRILTGIVNVAGRSYYAILINGQLEEIYRDYAAFCAASQDVEERARRS